MIHGYVYSYILLCRECGETTSIPSEVGLKPPYFFKIEMLECDNCEDHWEQV